MLRKKIFIIGSAGIPARYGGFETYAENIASLLSQTYNVCVVCNRKLYTKNERVHNGREYVKLIYLHINSNGIFSLFYDFISLLIAYKSSDFTILLGAGGSIFLPFFKIFRMPPIATHIDGMEWQRHKWNKLVGIYLRINTRLAIQYSNYILLDNQAMKSYIPQRYLNKVIITSYGGDHIPSVGLKEEINNRPYALVIARAEPENNIHCFLEAFKKIKDLELIIVSNWKDTKYGRNLYRKYAFHNNIKLTGPIYNDPVKLQTLRKRCMVYLHGHSAGGTNPSLIEAMYSGIPIIAFDSEFNRNTSDNLAIYFKSVEELIDSIQVIIKGNSQNNVRKMQEFAFKHYTWNNAIKPLKELLDRS